MRHQGKTTRMLEYAIGAARQGRKLAIIAKDDAHRAVLYKQARKLADAAGCAWVVGAADKGGRNGNLEVYSLTGHLAHEVAPGLFEIRGHHDTEVLVDSFTLETMYPHVIDNYNIRWI